MGVKKLYQADEEILFDIGGKGKTKVTIPKGGILFGWLLLEPEGSRQVASRCDL